MTSPKIHVFIRDADNTLIGEIDDYIDLQVNVKYNDVGSWTMTIPASSAKVNLLRELYNPDGGVYITRDTTVLISGPIRAFTWEKSQGNGAGVIKISGPDDTMCLAGRIIYPNPAAIPASQGTTYWYTVASTPTETIMRTLVNLNAGPGALLVRQVPTLSLAPDLSRGASQKSPKYRFDNLLEALQTLSTLSRAGGDRKTDLGFRVQQAGAHIQFQVYQGADLSSKIRFRFENDNITEASYTVTAPKTSYVILGAGKITDPLTASAVAAGLVDYTNSGPYYPFRSEAFIDVGEINPSETDASAQLAQKAADVFESGVGQVVASVTPLDTTWAAFGRDYYVGDYVTVQLPYITFVERIREVTLTYSASAGEAISTSIGTVDAKTAYKEGTSSLVKYVQKLRTIK